MTPDFTAQLNAEAIAWRIRLRDARAQDWEDFTEWLESDPCRAAAYDAVAIEDVVLDPALADWAQLPLVIMNDNEPVSGPSGWTRRHVAGGIGLLAAAAAAALLVITPQPRSPTDYYVVATDPGEQRLVTLGGRDRVALNGSTRVEFDRLNPRFASLVVGEAAFAVVHDARHPFLVELGTDRLLDVGTAFNVVRSGEGHKVEVSEGSVIYNPAGERITLAAGQTLSSKTKARQIILGHVPAAQVGGWQRGRLSYRSIPLANVAADLARSIGTPITVQSAIAHRTFTGTIEIDRNESRMFGRLEPLLDVDARRGRNGWTLGPVGQDQR